MTGLLQVSGGTICDLLAGLRSAGDCRALGVLEEALRRSEAAHETTGERFGLVRDLGARRLDDRSLRCGVSPQASVCALRCRI